MNPQGQNSPNISRCVTFRKVVPSCSTAPGLSSLRVRARNKNISRVGSEIYRIPTSCQAGGKQPETLFLNSAPCEVNRTSAA